jgi:hypothetical protein
MKINFKGGTNQIGKGRKGQNDFEGKKSKEERRGTEKRHKRNIRTIKFASYTRKMTRSHQSQAF